MRRHRGPTPGLAALVSVAVLVTLTYAAFVRTTPLRSPYHVYALVESSQGLYKNAPVRTAGVPIGRVTGLDQGPDGTARLTLQIDGKRDRPRIDATLRVRPRIFLEAGFYVALEPGTATASALPSGATIDLSHTAIAVRSDEILSTFDSQTRTSAKTVIHELNVVLARGGAGRLRDLARIFPPMLRYTAVTARASQGTEPGDATRVIRASARVSRVLAAHRVALGHLMESTDRTFGAFARRSGELRATLRESAALLRELPPVLADADRALAPTERYMRALLPALPELPATLRATSANLRELAALSRPDRLPRLLARLTPTLRRTPQLQARTVDLMRFTRSVSACSTKRIIPAFTTKLDDGKLSTGRPVWQDGLHAATGLASLAQTFDANGGFLRWDGGLGNEVISLGGAAGAGQMLGLSELPIIGARPQWNGPTPPPWRPDSDCEKQPLADLRAPAASAPGSRSVPASARLTGRERAGLLRRLHRGGRR